MIKEPTTRKVRNRGWEPVRYRTHNEVRHGAIIDRQPKRFKLWLVGDEGPRWKPNAELQFVTKL